MRKENLSRTNMLWNHAAPKVARSYAEQKSSLNENESWFLVNAPLDKKFVLGKRLFKIERNEHDHAEQNKSRFGGKYVRKRKV